MNEPLFTTTLIIIEVIFSIMVLNALHKAGAKKEVPLVLGAVLASWLGVVFLLLESGFIDSTSQPQITFTALVAIPVILGLIARKFWKPLGEAITNMPTESFISLQQMRAAFGVMFFFTAALPTWFQYLGGLGDIAAGVGAFLALGYLRNNPNKEYRANIRGNLVGILDFVVVLTVGVFIVLRDEGTGYMFLLIPLYVVPIFILLHIFSLQKLRSTAGYCQNNCAA